MAEYTFDKYMMVGERLDVAKAYNDGDVLHSPFAVVMGGDFYTEGGLSDKAGLVADWTLRVNTSSPKKSAPTEFVSTYAVAYNGEGLKTGELGVNDFATEGGLNMDDDYSYFPAETALHFEDNGGSQYDLWYINSKGDYETYGEKFTFLEDTESFTITWQDDIPDGKSDFISGFVVRTTPHTEPDR